MKKLKWKKTIAKKPKHIRVWGNSDRIKYLTTNMPFGGFLIRVVLKGYSLYGFSGKESTNKHIGTFLNINDAKKVAQLIYNG